MVNQLGTPQETDQLWSKLGQIQHYTNQLAKDTSKYLKDISRIPVAPSSADQKLRKMQVERLTKDFSDALSNFQVAQQRVAEKERASIAKARSQAGGKSIPYFDERASTQSDDQLISLSTGGFQSQAQAQLEDVDLDLLQERETAVRRLEEDIQDVNQIFKDLGMMVHEQGEVIDSIEANVETATIHVEEGTSSLRKAAEHQSKSRKKALAILLVTLIIILVLGLIMWAVTR
ncbi:PREDICTED: syntaxin-12-like isoform X2 [Priapulus caudatus]|nr:PREDICTED: syntaxin-12-like isoform X2 [Priapulus caudatus]